MSADGRRDWVESPRLLARLGKTPRLRRYFPLSYCTLRSRNDSRRSAHSGEWFCTDSVSLSPLLRACVMVGSERCKRIVNFNRTHWFVSSIIAAEHFSAPVCTGRALNHWSLASLWRSRNRFTARRHCDSHVCPLRYNHHSCRKRHKRLPERRRKWCGLLPFRRPATASVTP